MRLYNPKPKRGRDRWIVEVVRADKIQPGDTLIRLLTNPKTGAVGPRVVSAIHPAPPSQSQADHRFLLEDGGNVYYASKEEVLVAV